MDLSKNMEIKKRQGRMHPLSKFEREVYQLFEKLGFSQFDAPHIDTDYYNFEVLNIPKGHPARDLWDTLYIDKNNLDIKETLLLKTHTSNAQVRIMEKYPTPFRMFVLDRCFRRENLDARHEHTFDQFELVMVEKGDSMANLQFLS
jgi:phenylalanyl-tRNA synthetase alpha chain